MTRGTTRQPRDRATAEATAPSSAVIQDVILRHVHDAVFATDLQNRITYWASSAERLFGYAAGVAIGRRFGELLPFVMAGEADEADLRVTIEAGRTWRGQGAVRLGDGSELWIESTVNPIVVNGRSVGSVSVSRDMTEQRRAAGAMRGIEAVGTLLAAHGPVPSALEAVLRTLATEMGYRYLALLLVDEAGVRVGAQLGYEELPPSLEEGQVGIVGRVLRTGEAAFAPDVHADPDYLEGDEAVTSEIAVPLRAEGRILGVLNIESTATAPLTEADLRLVQAVADRLATALVLGQERQALADRARIFAALSEFGHVVDAILQEERLLPALVDAIGKVLPADVIFVTALDEATGRYLIRAARGVSDDAVGREIRPGDGVTGRAIAGRSLEAEAGLTRARLAASIRAFTPFDAISVAAVPLLREEAVLGAITIGRDARGPRFSSLEREVLSLLGSHAALALANARLVEEVSALAVHDGLTGLFNRRHFDAAAELVVARWRREQDPEHPLAAIIFDLDHFGSLNKQHGHQAGDTVLRAFAGILMERFRSSDLVARYGGEEFVVILEDCTVEDAVAAADGVRRQLETWSANGPDGVVLQARVSAGCATIDPAEPTTEALLRGADVALAMAKRGGRNQVVAA